jgi:hypothetical protein
MSVQKSVQTAYVSDSTDEITAKKLYNDYMKSYYNLLIIN